MPFFECFGRANDTFGNQLHIIALINPKVKINSGFFLHLFVTFFRLIGLSMHNSRKRNVFFVKKSFFDDKNYKNPIDELGKM